MTGVEQIEINTQLHDLMTQEAAIYGVAQELFERAAKIRRECAELAKQLEQEVH